MVTLYLVTPPWWLACVCEIFEKYGRKMIELLKSIVRVVLKSLPFSSQYHLFTFTTSYQLPPPFRQHSKYCSRSVIQAVIQLLQLPSTNPQLCMLGQPQVNIFCCHPNVQCSCLLQLQQYFFVSHKQITLKKENRKHGTS